MSEKISLLLDGQLAAGEVRAAIDQMAADSISRDRFTIYGLVGDVLRGNSTPDDGYSQRIFARMKLEQVRIEPGFDPLQDD